jgi:elongation factor P hydroxylase
MFNASIEQQGLELESEHDPEDLMRIFDQLFFDSENTRLLRGGNEPIYIPAADNCQYHQIIFAHGFFSSALHEIAHWCIAGKERCLQLDYGYWYVPDGRDQRQQAKFEQVEIKPQALEWLLSSACRKPFRVSVDNLGGVVTDTQPFKQAVYQQVLSYCQHGLPPRGQLLYQALADFYQSPTQLQASSYDLADIA